MPATATFHKPLREHPLERGVNPLGRALGQQHVQPPAEAGLVVGVGDHAHPHQEGDQGRVDGQDDGDAVQGHWTGFSRSGDRGKRRGVWSACL